MAGTRTSNRLTALAVDKQRRPGLYADGAGLTLVVTDKGVKRWELRAMTNGRRRQLGLGVYPQISLEAARRKAAGLREALREGAAVPAARQPRLVMSSVTPAPVTFRAAFVWRRSMTTTAQPDALPGKAQLSAWLLCRKPAVLRFRDIGEAVHKLAPRSTVKSVLEDGALLLEVDGIAVAVFTVEGQAPASLFDVGPYPHLYMRGPVQVCRDHKGYLIIQAPGDPADKAEALAKARAVTLVTRAAASSDRKSVV